MIVSAKYVEDDFRRYIEQKNNELKKSINEEEDDYYYDDYLDRYEYILDGFESEVDNFIVFLDDEKNVLNYAYFKEENGLEFISLGDQSQDVLIKNIEDIKNTFKHPHLYPDSEFYNLDKKVNLYQMDTNSKVLEGERYIPVENFLVLNEKDKTLYAKVCDEINFPKFSGKTIFRIKGYHDFMRDFEQSESLFSKKLLDEYNNYRFLGFHYAGLYDAKDDNVLILEDFETKNPLGVIKYGEYGEDKHNSLCFIDVNKPYRKNGLATKLLEEIGEHLDKNKPFFLTDESKMGETCHMRQKAIDSIKDVVVYYEDRPTTYEYVACYNGKEIERSMNFKDFNENIYNFIKEKDSNLSI